MKSSCNVGLKPIFIVFQIMALYPLPSPTIYAFFTVLSLSIGFWMFVSLLIISPILYTGSLHVFIGHIVFIIRIIVPITIISQAYCTRSKQLEIIQILSKVDEEFENGFGKTIAYKTLRTKYFLCFFAPILTLAAIRIYYIHDLIAYSTDTQFRFYWFHCVHSLMVSRTRCIQVAFYANLVNDRVLWMHQELQKMVQQKNLSQKNLQTKVVLLRHIYAMIYDVSVLINKSFGWSLLIIAVSYFADAVGNFYMIYLVIENSNVPRSTQIGAGVGFFSAALALIVVCYSCARCSGNARTTYDMIGKVLTHKIKWTTNYRLQEILLQVRHQNVVISANNFFTIDMNLLASIISAVITCITVIILA